MKDLAAVSLELVVVAAGLILLLAALWTPTEQKRHLGYAAGVAVGLVLVVSFVFWEPESRAAFGGAYLLDGLAIFFKRVFLAGACFVLVMWAGSSKGSKVGTAEFPVLVLFALAGMMFAASAGDFVLLFVALELVTVAFYVMTGFERDRHGSLEAGIKFLIMGALASAFLVLGIALVYGTAGTMSFDRLRDVSVAAGDMGLSRMGLVLVFVGLGFKLAVVPSQMWAPDVYEGAPAPAGAFLAAGSKAVGLVLLIRVASATGLGDGGLWGILLVVVSAASILYGGLCAIAQRNLKRLLGYSSIVTGGYLMLGLASGSAAGLSAALYYIAAYMFAVVAAFTVITVVFPAGEVADLAALGGLHKRSPLLAGVMALAMISLAGVPPLAGFFGKFLLLKAAIGATAGRPELFVLIGVAVAGVCVSIYYYFGVIRAMYWLPGPARCEPIVVGGPIRWSLYLAAVGLLWLGLLPGMMTDGTARAATGLMTRGGTPIVQVRGVGVQPHVDRGGLVAMPKLAELP